MIRPCTQDSFATILAVINEGAEAYRGVIPQDRLRFPYMSAPELEHEIDTGVQFSAAEENGETLGVMGVQRVQDVILIRHAYVRTAFQGRGIGSMLLMHLLAGNDRPVLIGAWAAATWAVRFYERHGFRTVDPMMRVRLLQQYWTVPERQIETSVVLADERWWQAQEQSTA